MLAFFKFRTHTSLNFEDNYSDTYLANAEFVAQT